jgi:hypothetical protein
MLHSITTKVVPDGATTLIRKADIEEWLVTDDHVSAGEDEDGEAEWTGDGKLEERPLYGVRRLLDYKRVASVKYYLVDWELSWKTRSDVGGSMIASFWKARRALVPKTYIEDRAKEAGK